VSRHKSRKPTGFEFKDAHLRASFFIPEKHGVHDVEGDLFMPGRSATVTSLTGEERKTSLATDCTPSQTVIRRAAGSRIEVLDLRVKTFVSFLIFVLTLPLAASAETAESVAANELANARRLLSVLETKVRATRFPEASDLRRLEVLRANVAARTKPSKSPVVPPRAVDPQPAPAPPPPPPPQQPESPNEPTSRLTAWSTVLQKQVPVRKGTRVLVEGVLATVVEVVHPYQVLYLRVDGVEGAFTGRREYSSVYATVEVGGIEAASVYKGDLVQSGRGAMVGTVEAVFDNGAIFVERFNGEVEWLGTIGEPRLSAFTFKRTRAASCRMSF
jgi:hypothetical protein